MAVTLKHPGRIAEHRARYLAHQRAAEARGDADQACRLAAHVDRLTLQLARAERCRHCGRPLENAESIARGIGSTCWAKGAR